MVEGGAPAFVRDLDPVTEACNPTACHRLVDGWRVERRRAGEASWEPEHERLRSDSPTADTGYGQAWEEVPSIATTDRPDRDEAVVAAGRDGALVRRESGRWRSAAVGESLLRPYMPWLSAIVVTTILLVGAAVGVAGHLLIRWSARPARHAPKEMMWPVRGERRY